jgi:hypothetical protein
MKHLLIALLLQLPAQAFPQWIPVSLDRTVLINFNSVKSYADGIRSVDSTGVDFETTLFISCPTWRYSSGSGWNIIRPGSTAETVAYTVCPPQ